MVRKIDLKTVLFMLGYNITSKGIVEESNNQLGLISLENTGEGGILRIHSDVESFFYKGEDLEGLDSLCFLSKVSSKYVYFDGAEEVKVNKKDFEDFLFHALTEYYSVGKQGVAG